MGLLKFNEDKIFSYKESKKYQKFLKKECIKTLKMFFKNFFNHQNSDKNIYKYGFEFEINLIEKEDNLKLGKKENFDELMKENKSNCFDIFPEYANFMIEIVPKLPFQQLFNFDLIKLCLKNIKNNIDNCLKDSNLKIFSLSSLMNLGSSDLKINNEIIPIKERKFKNIYSKSDFFNDELINPHPRFLNLTKNVRKRRRQKPNILVPIFKDVNTKNNHENEIFDGFLYLDAFGFGMGNNSLQLTYSTKDLNTSRFLYDQLHIISFIFMSLTASTSVYKKYLINFDTRWRLIENSTDDRNLNERKRLPKGRYSNINYFISNDKKMKHKYNDNKYFINKKFKKELKKNLKEEKIEIDDRLLNHFSYLFIRENLVFFEDYLKLNGEEDITLFETILSTNWNNVRLKTPETFNSERGWLVEFRPMENVLTDKEKFVFINIVTLFVRMITDKDFNINFYIPASLCDINFNKSHNIDSLIKEKFYFRNNLFGNKNDSFDLYTMKEIFQGKNDFIGLNNVIKKYLDFNKKIKEEEKEIILDILNFINERAEGKLPTLARYIRNFVRSHKNYKYDSFVNNIILKDLYDNLYDLQIDNNPKSSKILFGNNLSKINI